MLTQLFQSDVLSYSYTINEAIRLRWLSVVYKLARCFRFTEISEGSYNNFVGMPCHVFANNLDHRRLDSVQHRVT